MTSVFIVGAGTFSLSYGLERANKLRGERRKKGNKITPTKFTLGDITRVTQEGGRIQGLATRAFPLLFLSPGNR